MSRCDYEGVFYRVFCASLLVIAFTFTLILTNVFIDIDGLLSRKEQELAGRQADHVTPTNFIEKHETKEDKKRIEKEHIEFKNYDNEGVYRTKRSLDSTDFLLHIKNPKLKNVLANRLATLLEELEDDESKSEIIEKNDKTKIDIVDVYMKTEDYIKNDVTEKSEVAAKKEDIGIHTAIHNLLREGIVGHMDMSSVYKKVHELVKKYKSTESKKQENILHSHPGVSLQVTVPTTTINEENQLFEELVKCKTLQKEVVGLTSEKKKENTTKGKIKGPKFLIKTFIDIQKTDKDPSSKEVRGIIKLIYNGKSVKIKNMDEYEATTLPKPIEVTATEHVNTSNVDAVELLDVTTLNKEIDHLSKTRLDHLLTEYLKKYKDIHDIPVPSMKYIEKRIKRDIKIEDDQIDKLKKNEKAEDDELFVEIETHYDNKGMKGKKKEELVKQLIEKIQKAIRSNKNENKPLKHLHEIHVRKRVQNPLDHKNESRHIMLKDIILPYGTSSFYRDLYPISKIGTNFDLLPIVNNGENWMQKETGPKFTSASKSINSAELSQVDVDYKKVVEISSVPQRLQIPLNTDLSGESPNAFFDLGNLQFLIKDLEGSGFSVGVNQYIDHAPDPESTKLFTGIEKLVSKYQQNYDHNFLSTDQTDVPKHEMNKRDLNTNLVEKNDKKYKHKIRRRSIIKGNEGNYNEYFIYKDKLPYKNYQEIYEDKEKNVLSSISDDKYQEVNENLVLIKEMPKDLEHIFEKKLKPSEIFNLATLLDRNKRSVKVRKFNNLKKKIHMSTFINTKGKPAQKILFKSKRNKRHVGKIRIIAKDTKGNSESDENIYIVSGEHLYADRAILRNSDNEYTYKAKEQVKEPKVFENTKPPLYNVFEESIRHSPYMMKYPHIFLDEVNDKFSIEAPTRFGKVIETMDDIEMTTENDLVDKMDTIPSVHDLVYALKPSSKAKYKVTVKILPKESNITNGGFREVHTSINKTFNKNGMLYSSLVNVSEISKIETANTSVEKNKNDNIPLVITTTPNVLQNKHEELKNIIKEHKERIDKQLDNLHKEKAKLTSILLNNTYETTTKKSELMDILLNLRESKMLNLNKDDISKVCNAVNQEKTTTTTIKPVTTTTPKAVMDPLKVKLLKAISQNEQLTTQILNKIDQNSLILQSFLSKISDKIQTLPDITRQVLLEHEKKVQTPRLMHSNYADPHFRMKPPNISDSGVPYNKIYYQQPNVLKNKVETPEANAVYDGYRSANQVVNHKINTPKTNLEFKNLQNEMVLNNTNRYFVDDDFFRPYVSPIEKKEDSKNEGKLEQDYRLNMPKPQIIEKKDTIVPYKFKNNTPVNITINANHLKQ